MSEFRWFGTARRHFMSAFPRLASANRHFMSEFRWLESARQPCTSARRCKSCKLHERASFDRPARSVSANGRSMRQCVYAPTVPRSPILRPHAPADFPRRSKRASGQNLDGHRAWHRREVDSPGRRPGSVDLEVAGAPKGRQVRSDRHRRGSHGCHSEIGKAAALDHTAETLAPLTLNAFHWAGPRRHCRLAQWVALCAPNTGLSSSRPGAQVIDPLVAAFNGVTYQCVHGSSALCRREAGWRACTGSEPEKYDRVTSSPVCAAMPMTRTASTPTSTDASPVQRTPTAPPWSWTPSARCVTSPMRESFSKKACRSSLWTRPTTSGHGTASARRQACQTVARG